MPDLAPILSDIVAGRTLSEDEACSAFQGIMSGDVDSAQIAAFLTALRMRGETIDEIIGGAKVMRANAARINAPDATVDTCGTGGSGIDSFNVSTAAAFVIAAAGIPVAKHGNRAASSKSGSADVLEALGGNLELSIQQVQQTLDETGFTFMFARTHHQAVRHVVPVRSALKFKTIFNLLGPLSSPALAKRQVMGVFDRHWVRPLAEVLRGLGSDHAWVVHGSDGLDEITTTGTTYVAELKDNIITEFEVDPEDIGINLVKPECIRGGDAQYNALAIESMMNGEKSAFRDIVSLNAAASLIVGGKIDSLQAGIDKACELIDSGAAKATMVRWARYTQQFDGKA
ncbi:anthranilate phosphoribosyltransferase [Kordiimonas aquimaris]|uniref:anthranilate phosphoribosyltransferase n=1 Tax=Kordiimonas aquimaris TaxID=707591 RepID=UPI0021CFF1C6|nr:anthranilate phosphoribosyltransferase [Kordiimonas aquimaris]